MIFKDIDFCTLAINFRQFRDWKPEVYNKCKLLIVPGG